MLFLDFLIILDFLIKVISKFMTQQPGYQTMAIRVLTNISG